MRTLNEIRADMVGKAADVGGRKGTIADIRQFKGSGQFLVDLSGGGMKISNTRRVDMKVVFKDSGEETWVKGVHVE